MACNQEWRELRLSVCAGSHALNPATGKAVPIWVADYVLGSYGSGAIMAVPAHDSRDFEFATQYDLPVVRVVQGSSGEDDVLPFTGVFLCQALLLLGFLAKHIVIKWSLH